MVEVFKKQRPGEPPTLENARNLLRGLFFDPKRYDRLVGRYKLNQRLEVPVADDIRVLTTQDILALVKRLVDLPIKLGVDPETKDYAADAITSPASPSAASSTSTSTSATDACTVGELIQEAFRVGLYRMERVVRERMTTEDVDTITPQTIINIRPVVAALKEFFGSAQLSQFMDQTNSLAGLTHRRRLSALGAGGLTRERAPIEVRDVHTTHYGRMCPIETPEGAEHRPHGLARLDGDGVRVRLRDDALPHRRRRQGHRQDRYLDASEEEKFVIAQANEPVDEKTGKFANATVLCRGPGGEPVEADPKTVAYMDVNPAQIVSVATALIPVPRAQRREPRAHGREHAAAGSAAHDHRAAADRHRPRVPAAVDTGDVVMTRTRAPSSTSTPTRSPSRRRTARTSTSS